MVSCAGSIAANSSWTTAASIPSPRITWQVLPAKSLCSCVQTYSGRIPSGIYRTVMRRPQTPPPPNPLQQRPAFAHGPSMLVGIERAIVLEWLQIVATRRPADRGRVMIVQDRRPVVARDLARVALHARRFARQRSLPGLGAPIDIHP